MFVLFPELLSITAFDIVAFPPFSTNIALSSLFVKIYFSVNDCSFPLTIVVAVASTESLF